MWGSLNWTDLWSSRRSLAQVPFQIVLKHWQIEFLSRLHLHAARSKYKSQHCIKSHRNWFSLPSRPAVSAVSAYLSIIINYDLLGDTRLYGRSTSAKLWKSFSEKRENPSRDTHEGATQSHVPVRAVTKASTRCRAIPGAPSIFFDRGICKSGGG